MRYDAVVVASGKGQRANLGFNKAFFVMKNGKCVLENACSLFLNDDDCQRVIVVCNDRLPFKHEKIVCTRGGKERYNSVACGLKLVESPFVFVHDGVRPFLCFEDLENLKTAMERADAAILAKPAVDTIKFVEDGAVVKTLDRQQIFAALTPQAFKSDLLKEAYASLDLFGVTDDASLIERLGYNRKLTWFEDFRNI